MDHENLHEFELMWTADRERYVLIKPDPKGYSRIPLIYDAIDCFGLNLEDDFLTTAIVDRMLAAGVPLVDEAPPGINPVTKVQLEMLEAGASADEINRVVRELVDQGVGDTNALFGRPKDANRKENRG